MNTVKQELLKKKGGDGLMVRRFNKTINNPKRILLIFSVNI